MKKLSLTVLSVICAICMAFGLMIMTNLNTASADTAGQEPTLSETKVMVSTAKDKMLLATAIKNYADVYEVGYTFTGEVTPISQVNNRYYTSITSGGVTKYPAEIFGNEYDGAGMIIWEIPFSVGTEYAFKPYAIYGDRNAQNQLVPAAHEETPAESFTKQFYTVTVAANNGGYGSVSKSEVLVPSGSAISVDGNVVTVGGIAITATATDATAQYTYGFTNFTGTAATVTENIEITANFTRTVNEYTVSIASNNVSYGTVDVASVANVPYGTAITVNDNVITINGTDVTATKSTDDVVFTYGFTGFTGTAATVTGNMAITANFTREVNDFTASLDKSSVGAKIGDTVNLSYLPAVDSSLTEWTTSNGSVATVSNGQITCVGAGTAVITLDILGETATCTVVVAPAGLDVLSDIKTDYKVLDGISGLSDVAYKINNSDVNTDTYAFDKNTSYTVTASCTYNEEDFAIDVPVTVTDFANVDFAADNDIWGLMHRFNGSSSVTEGTYQERDDVLLEGHAYLDQNIINAAREAGFWTLTFDAYIPSLSATTGAFMMPGYIESGNIHNVNTSAQYVSDSNMITYAEITDADTAKWITFYLDISRFYDDELILMMTSGMDNIVISNVKFHWVPQLSESKAEITNAEFETYGQYILIPCFKAAVAGATLTWMEGGYRSNRPYDPSAFSFDNTWTMSRGYLVQAHNLGKDVLNLNIQGMGTTAIGSWLPWDDYSGGNAWAWRGDVGWSDTTKTIDLTYAMQNKTPSGDPLTVYNLTIQDRLDYVLTLSAYQLYIQVESFSFSEAN